MALKRGIFNGIKVNETIIPRPSDFNPIKENVYAGELTTCTGKLIADCIGWKFSDMTLSWDYLQQSDLNVLLNAGQSIYIEFDFPDGTTTTTYREQVIVTDKTSVGSRFTDSAGNQIWHDVSMGVRFVNVH